MHSKVAEVFNALRADWSNEYNEVEENRIYVKTPLTSLGHATYLTFSVTADVLRVDLKHIFGTLDADQATFEGVAPILGENDGSFCMSSGYAAMEVIDGVVYVSLQTYRTFFIEWNSREIAGQLDLAFDDIKRALLGLAVGVGKGLPRAIRMLSA